MSVFQHFERNTVGRDFVFGDVHGCLETFQALLEKIHFDESKDRAFMEGDLVDRGPHSLDMLLMTRLPWFHAQRGNHEEFICQYMDGKPSAIGRCHIENGGEWFYNLPEEGKIAALELVRALPFCMSIDTAFGTVGMSHAGVLDDWNTHVDSWMNHASLSKNKLEKLYHRTLWSRSRIKNNVTTPVTGVPLVMVGHSPVPEVCALGNVLYIDTGCGAGRWPAAWQEAGYNPRLTAVELTSPLVYHHQERLDTVVIYR